MSSRNIVLVTSYKYCYYKLEIYLRFRRASEGHEEYYNLFCNVVI